MYKIKRFSLYQKEFGIVKAANKAAKNKRAVDMYKNSSNPADLASYFKNSNDLRRMKRLNSKVDNSTEATFRRMARQDKIGSGSLGAVNSGNPIHSAVNTNSSNPGIMAKLQEVKRSNLKDWKSKNASDKLREIDTRKSRV